MYVRVMMLKILIAVILLLSACENAPSYTGYLEEDISPCTPVSGSSVDPCEPGAMVAPISGGFGSGGVTLYDAPPTLRQRLSGGSIAHVPHIVLRGTYIPETVRCIKNIPMRTPSYVSPSYFQNSIRILCYVDVRVNDYILGEGPSRLPVQVYFLNYWEGYFAQDAANFGITEEAIVEQIRAGEEFILEEGPHGTGGIGGREVILFIGPPASYSHGVWQIFDTWDVQRREDGTVVAVHPHRDAWREVRPADYLTHKSSLEVELPAFTQAAKAAQQARVNEYGGRIAAEDVQSRVPGVDLPLLITDVHGLDEFMENTGAYDHQNGTPMPPPPVPGEGDPTPEIGVDDSTSESTPPIPGG